MRLRWRTRRAESWEVRPYPLPLCRRRLPGSNGRRVWLRGADIPQVRQQPVRANNVGPSVIQQRDKVIGTSGQGVHWDVRGADARSAPRAARARDPPRYAAESARQPNRMSPLATAINERLCSLRERPRSEPARRKTFEIHIDDGMVVLTGGAEQWLTSLWPMT